LEEIEVLEEKIKGIAVFADHDPGERGVAEVVAKEAAFGVSAPEESGGGGELGEGKIEGAEGAFLTQGRSEGEEGQGVDDSADPAGLPVLIAVFPFGITEASDAIVAVGFVPVGEVAFVFEEFPCGGKRKVMGPGGIPGVAVAELEETFVEVTEVGAVLQVERKTEGDIQSGGDAEAAVGTGNAVGRAEAVTGFGADAGNAEGETGGTPVVGFFYFKAGVAEAGVGRTGEEEGALQMGEPDRDHGGGAIAGELDEAGGPGMGVETGDVGDDRGGVGTEIGGIFGNGGGRNVAGGKAVAGVGGGREKQVRILRPILEIEMKGDGTVFEGGAESAEGNKFFVTVGRGFERERPVVISLPGDGMGFAFEGGLVLTDTQGGRNIRGKVKRGHGFSLVIADREYALVLRVGL
jgi:hypothetical protein